MRLTQPQIKAIRATTAEIFGEGAKVWLFGSRVEDQRRGGDIDLLIQPPTEDQTQNRNNPWDRKTKFLARLTRRIGERKVDVVVEEPGDARPIVEIAHRTGIRL
jgi:uncharacterized protein